MRDADKAVTLKSEVGPFSFLIAGESTGFEDGVLAFQFRTVDVSLGSNRIWGKDNTNSKPKTYTFFYADEQIAAARSSAGGLSLLLRL